MKNMVSLLGAFVLAGCGSGGIVFNGKADVTQLEVRRTPIVHYPLPTEDEQNPPALGISDWLSSNLAYDDFAELPFPGHDMWAMNMNPAGAGWAFAHDQYKTPGAGWPNPAFNTILAQGGRPACEYIAAWILSFQNQWFLRDFNGAPLNSPTPGEPPVRYASAGFSSMAISLHEVGSAVSPFSQLLGANPATSAQQEVGDPTTVGFNNVQKIAVPANNVIGWDAAVQPNAPAGLLGAGWRETLGENKCIETSAGNLVNVPVPDYFGGGGPINCTGGIYMIRFSNNWQQTTAGTNSAVNINDGVTYSYFLAVIANHLVGYGLGLTASAFALPSAITKEEHIMTTSVVYDLTAFIAAGKLFQFQLGDLLILQDVATGTYLQPGPDSTLPGSFR